MDGTHKVHLQKIKTIPATFDPDWFPYFDGEVEKVTLALPDKVLKQQGMLPNGPGKWFFVHLRDIKNLFGLGYMVTLDMIPHLYSGQRQNKTIEELAQEQKEAAIKKLTEQKDSDMSYRVPSTQFHLICRGSVKWIL